MNRQYINQGEKRTALYVRLSRDDENDGDSNSISHQMKSSPDTAKTIIFFVIRFTKTMDFRVRILLG